MIEKNDLDFIEIIDLKIVKNWMFIWKQCSPLPCSTKLEKWEHIYYFGSWNKEKANQIEALLKSLFAKRKLCSLQQNYINPQYIEKSFLKTLIKRCNQYYRESIFRTLISTWHQFILKRKVLHEWIYLFPKNPRTYPLMKKIQYK